MNVRERIVEKFEMSQMAKNGASNYRTIGLPKKVIIRTETVEEVESTKQAKIREVGMMPQKPEEGIEENGRKIAEVQIRIEKQAKIREEVMVPPKLEGGIGKNGGKIAEKPKNAPIKKMINSNRRITEIHTKVSPRRYYIMMMFGLVTAIIGAAMFFVTNDLLYVLIIISGVGIFLMESIDFKEAKEVEKRFKTID